jgi:hypothetical protein
MAVETPEIAPAVERPCPHCGSAMAPGQDWCRECGIAAPGRLTSRAGWRAALTIVATVLLLVGGAVAASYAALNSKAQQTAAAPAPPSGAPQVAQVPATTTTPPPAPATPPPTTSTPTPPPAPTPTPAPAPAPTTPAPTTSTPAPAPAPTPAPTTPKTPAAPTGHRPLDLGVDIASVYDPDKAATDQTDPSDSYDENRKTVFTVSTDPAKPEMGVGLDFDLGHRQKVERLSVRTTTPGFTVEVYGAKAGLPPDILDTRWQHLASAKDAGSTKGKKGLVQITFPAGTYRHVVLWFTTPPPAGPTVGISEVRILD